MRGLNKATLIGNLGKDPDVQTLEGNLSVAKFSLATTESFKDKNGQIQYSTERSAVAVVYHCALAKLGRTSREIVAERQSCDIEGKLKTRSYDDRDGHKRYVTEVVADQLIVLNKKIDDGHEHD